MIGRWLQNIATPAARAALLTGRFVAFTLRAYTESRQVIPNTGCLLGLPAQAGSYNLKASSNRTGEFIAHRFNALCMRLEGRPRREYLRMMRGTYPLFDLNDITTLCPTGAAKAGILIRARILEIEARRELVDVPMFVGSATEVLV